MAEMNETMTSRQRLNERYKGRNPELNVDDDEALGAAILGDLDAYDESEERRRRFNETVQNSKIAPEMMAGILSGKNPDGTDFDLEDYLIDKHLDLLLDVIENKETAKAKADARRKERQKEADFEAKAEELAKAEDDEFAKAVEEGGYKPEQAMELATWIYGEKGKNNGLVYRAFHHGLTKDDFLKMFQIKDFDQKLASAEDKGYKRGRNEKIDMFKRGQEKREKMPADIGGGGAMPQGEKPEDPYLAKLNKMKKY